MSAPGHYFIVAGMITPEYCRIEIRDSDLIKYEGRGFTIDDAFADAIRKRNAAAQTFCSFEDCDQEPTSSGLCQIHERDEREHAERERQRRVG